MFRYALLAAAAVAAAALATAAEARDQIRIVGSSTVFPFATAVCGRIREDGAFIEAGENDVLIVQKPVANPHAYGIFGYSFLDTNADKIQGTIVEGVAPEAETISAGTYPISRALYFYANTAHIGVIPGMKEYITEFTSERAWSPDGYLAEKGLIPLSDADRRQARAEAMSGVKLAM